MSDPLDNAINTFSEALRVPVRAEWKAEVKIQMQAILRHGSLVTEFPLPDDIEPAPVYEA